MAATAKSRDVVGELYTSLCGDPELPVNVQWRIYEYAAREKKFALMARLVSLPHLDPDLDVKLGTHAESKVRAAWIGRTGRPITDVLEALEQARKGPVYAAAAAVTGLPKDVYRMLASDGRVDTAQELLANPDVPTDVKTAAAVTFGTSYKPSSTYRSRRILMGLFTEQLGLLDTLVSQTSNPGIIAFAAEHVALPEPSLIRLVEEVIEPLLLDTTPAKGWEEARSIVDSVTHLLRQPGLPSERRDRLHGNVAAFARMNQHLHVRQEDARKAMEDGPNYNLPTASHPNLDLMRNAETVEQVEAAAKIALRSRDGELATALACNSSTDAKTVISLLPLIPREIQGRVAYARARDIDVLAAVVVHNAGWGIMSDALLAASGKPAEALIAVVREYRATGKPMPQSLGRSEYITPSVMGALPLSFTSKKGSMLARRAVGDLLSTALGSARDWELFETLGNNFDGPLENLLLACGYVTAPAGEHTPTHSQAAPDGPDENPSGELVDPDGIATWSLF